MEILEVVDDQNQVVGVVPRDQVYSDFLNHRIVHIIVLNSKRQVALQLRSQNVSFLPRHWCTAAVGHVQSGESYEKAASRELKEELGIDRRLKLLAEDVFVWSQEKGSKKFIQVFLVEHDDLFSMDKNDVEKVEFFEPQEILAMLDRGEKFHPESFFILKRFINNEYVS